MSKQAKQQQNGKLKGPKPAPKTGPCFNLRFRSKKQIKAMHTAAEAAGMSTNTWAMLQLEKAAAQ